MKISLKELSHYPLLVLGVYSLLYLSKKIFGFSIDLNTEVIKSIIFWTISIMIIDIALHKYYLKEK